MISREGDATRTIAVRISKASTFTFILWRQIWLHSHEIGIMTVQELSSTLTTAPGFHTPKWGVFTSSAGWQS